MENKAGLTGQTVPGRRIPGHWPYPGPEELAEAEPVGPDAWTFLSFDLTPPPRARERVTRYPLTVSLSITRSPLVRPSRKPLKRTDPVTDSARTQTLSNADQRLRDGHDARRKKIVLVKERGC